MSDPQSGKGNSLGLAVGATNLAGTGDGQRPVIRASAVTLERGMTLTGFVDRIGDPVPMVAQDGSRHRPEILLVEALDGVARIAARTPVSEVAVAVPAHWRPSAVEALRSALRSKPGLARSPLVSDATAALTALRSSPGLPTAGVIVLCDFGGSGAGITLVDAAAEDAPIGETVRVPDFSGDQIDQAVLTKVVAEVFEASDADPAGTSMVGSLAVLRDECRRGKERLSDETATAINVGVPGMETTVRMTRKELEGLIDEPLDGFLATLAETLQRNRIPLASISAVATVGGGARIPLITQRLSEHLRTTVVTTPQPQLTAAAGAALIAERSQVVETATAIASAAPAAPATATVAAAALRDGAAPAVGGALAWSEVDDDAYDVLHTEPYREDRYARSPADSRPEVHFRHEEREDRRESRRRVPAVLAGLAAAAVLVAGVVFGLTAITRDTSTVPAGTSSGIAPVPAPAAQQQEPAAAPAPAMAPGVTTVVARPQPRYAPRPQQVPVVQQAPPHSAPAPEAPAPAPPAPEPEPSAPAPAPENPAPPTDPETGTPPIDPGTGGGTGSGGSGTPPIDPGTGGGQTGTGGTGAGGTGTTPGTGPATGTGTAAGGEEKAPAKPGLVAPILEPILTPQS
jgi:actin-like ATPase involved in cell morphogenesis